MSAKVRLSSKLPGEPEINGLDELSATLAEDPHQIICALVFLDSLNEKLESEQWVRRRMEDRLKATQGAINAIRGALTTALADM